MDLLCHIVGDHRAESSRQQPSSWRASDVQEKKRKCGQNNHRRSHVWPYFTSHLLIRHPFPGSLRSLMMGDERGERERESSFCVLGQGASTAMGEESDANAGAKGVESPDQMSNPTLLAILNLSVFRSPRYHGEDDL